MLKYVFALEKLNILIYDSRSRLGKPKDEFQVMFNPESYSLEYVNTFQQVQGINTSGRPAKYSLSKPEELSITLIIDNTGVANYSSQVNGKKITDVSAVVNRFLELTTLMDGELHRPNYLSLIWGNFQFDCCLKSVKINYTLFDHRGRPIRAELEAVFLEDEDDEKRVKEEKKSSPDLTHSRTIMGGDKLPLMAQEIYQDPAYYIKLARANKLNNFRNIKIGKTIDCPPVKN